MNFICLLDGVGNTRRDLKLFMNERGEGRILRGRKPGSGRDVLRLIGSGFLKGRGRVGRFDNCLPADVFAFLKLVILTGRGKILLGVGRGGRSLERGVLRVGKNLLCTGRTPGRRDGKVLCTPILGRGRMYGGSVLGTRGRGLLGGNVLGGTVGRLLVKVLEEADGRLPFGKLFEDTSTERPGGRVPVDVTWERPVLRVSTDAG